ncbi:MAG: formylglycine-generating enzyme family protein [Leptospirales bacterium]|nr:formylglycine-generating enzyme family protein [Leptospirales bacterium]
MRQTSARADTGKVQRYLLARAAILFALVLPLVVSQAQSPSQPDPAIPAAAGGPLRQGQTDRWEFVALGEVVAVQKNMGVMRVAGPEPALLRRRNESALRDFFLRENPELTILNQGGLVAGRFSCTRVVVEGLPGGRDIILHGYFEAADGNELRVLAVGHSAGLYRHPPGYLPPPASGIRPRQPHAEIRHPIDGKWMVYIPEEYIVFGQGDDAEADNFNPQFYSRTAANLTKVKPFYIDRYEVTNAEYLRFLQASSHPAPPAWAANGGRFPDGQQDHPITVASYADAEAYARWSGKRLPVELEWELAARGGLAVLARRFGREGMNRRPQLYPTGDEFFADRCNTLESGRGSAVSVYEMHDESPYGVIGMCGNAREWTSSWYQAYPGSRLRNAAGAAGRIFKVIRGGSFAQRFEFARSDTRDYGGLPTLAADRSAGFRLVLGAQ